jgi:hypothetical protein
VDWNEDGMKDMILGGGTGRVRIYLNTNTDDDPVFTSYGVIVAAGFPLDVGEASTPEIVDWNNDGVRDLLVGAWTGKIYLLINTGTNAAPLFPSKPYVQEGGSALVVNNGYSAPLVLDYNQDGKKDLVAGGADGLIYFYENVGTDQNPQFNGSVILTDDLGVINMVKYSKPDFSDWNGDGVPDLLCGGTDGRLTYCQTLAPLSLSNNQLSETGGVIDFFLDGGIGNANSSYHILGSISGTEPGLPIPYGPYLPLSWDFFTDLVIKMANSPVLPGFRSTLDATGFGSAQFDTLGPLPPGFVGVKLYFAYLLYESSTSTIFYASNWAKLEITP